MWPFTRRRPEYVNYAETSAIRHQGVSGIPESFESGEVVESVSVGGSAFTPVEQAETKSGPFSGLKSLLAGRDFGVPVQQARRTVDAAMGLVSPWLSGVVWTINRVFFALAREAYGGNAVVYAALRLLSTAVSEPPLVPHYIDDNHNRQELDWDHPLYKLIRHPNEIMTEMGFIELSVIHMGLVGRCHWWKERDNLGRIKALWPLRPDRVGPLYATQPVLAYGYSGYPGDAGASPQPYQNVQNNLPTNIVTDAGLPLKSDNRILAGWTYWPPGWSIPLRIPREDVMTINLSDPSAETGGVVEGLGPVQVLAREIEADNEATSFVAAILKNMAIPGGILHVKTQLMREKAAVFKREFKKMFGGTHRGELAIFDGDTAFTQLGFNMQQLEFPNLRKVSETRISASLGIPTMLVGFYSGLESANRSTLSEFREYFAETTLPPWWRRIQEQYTKNVAREFADNYIVTFDTSKVKALLVQAARSVQPYDQAFKAGVLTVNEYRQNILGLPPLEGPMGNMLYLPANISPTDASMIQFDYIGTGVAANYGADAPDMDNTLQDPESGRITTPGGMNTPTPRLPHSDAPSPDSANMTIPPVKSIMRSGTGVCFSCGALMSDSSKGFRCSDCVKKRGLTDIKFVETYTHIGDRGRPWVPSMKWRHLKAVEVEREPETKPMPMPRIPKAAEPVVNSVLGQEPEYSDRPERRFLLPSVTLVTAQLEKHDADIRPLRQYDVKTLYLDTPNGSWSSGDESMPKLRHRSYPEGGSSAFFELKWTSDGVSTKKRIEAENPPEGLTPICTITYTRTEWEIDTTRITIDDDVRTEAGADDGETRRLPFFVVEVKGALPFWLSFITPYENDEFSKTKWALGRWQVPQPQTKTVYRGFQLSASELGLSVGKTYIERDPVIVTPDKKLVEMLLGPQIGTIMAIKVPADFNAASLPPSRFRVTGTTDDIIEAEIIGEE